MYKFFGKLYVILVRRPPVRQRTTYAGFRHHTVNILRRKFSLGSSVQKMLFDILSFIIYPEIVPFIISVPTDFCLVAGSRLSRK